MDMGIGCGCGCLVVLGGGVRVWSLGGGGWLGLGWVFGVLGVVCGVGLVGGVFFVWGVGFAGALGVGRLLERIWVRPVLVVVCVLGVR